MEQRIPLAERMRPQRLSEVVGQNHLLGTEGVIRKALNSGIIPSMILWGPPGVGKTTMARLLANELDRPFHTLSAINSGVKEVREVIALAEGQGLFIQNSVLFIDEIHRFSKSQQDSLLGAVERGTVTLIGATTENPSFEVISALLSRSQVYKLEPLDKDHMLELIDRSCEQDEELQALDVHLDEVESLLRASGGDARRLLNIFELAVRTGMASSSSSVIHITDELVKEVVQSPAARYDKTGEQHYDIISAFIKSIRGSDADAAVYWLARMVEGGEDPKFIARRLVISAAEDIGLANPNALVLANSAAQAIQLVGWPEGRIILSEATIYLANSPKSNSAYLAIGKAQQLVRESGDLSVPLHLRNAPTQLMKDLGYGADYKYSHDSPEAYQQFLPDSLHGEEIYTPGINAKEQSRVKAPSDRLNR